MSHVVGAGAGAKNRGSVRARGWTLCGVLALAVGCASSPSEGSADAGLEAAPDAAAATGGTSSRGGNAGSGGATPRGSGGAPGDGSVEASEASSTTPRSDPGFVSCYPVGFGARCDLSKGEACCEPRPNGAGRPWGSCHGGSDCIHIASCDEDADCPPGETCENFFFPGLAPSYTKCSGSSPFDASTSPGTDASGSGDGAASDASQAGDGSSAVSDASSRDSATE